MRTRRGSRMHVSHEIILSRRHRSSLLQIRASSQDWLRRLDGSMMMMMMMEDDLVKRKDRFTTCQRGICPR